MRGSRSTTRSDPFTRSATGALDGPRSESAAESCDAGANVPTESGVLLKRLEPL